MEALQTMITNLTTQLQGMVGPFAIFGLVLWGIAFLLTPLLPEWSQEMRGYFKKALLVVGFVGFVPGLITAMAAMGGGVA